jgi:hypothetical protein
VPLSWSLGTCQLSATQYEGAIPSTGRLPAFVELAADGALTLPPIPAADAGMSLSFDAAVTDSLGSCTTSTFSIPIISRPTARVYPLATPELGVPYTSFVSLGLLGLGGNPGQGGTPPYACPPAGGGAPRPSRTVWVSRSAPTATFAPGRR